MRSSAMMLRYAMGQLSDRYLLDNCPIDACYEIHCIDRTGKSRHGKLGTFSDLSRAPNSGCRYILDFNYRALGASTTKLYEIGRRTPRVFPLVHGRTVM